MELPDDLFSLNYVLNYSGFVEDSFRVVICVVPFILNINKPASEVLDFHREILDGLSAATPPGSSIFQGPIGLLPSRRTPVRPGAADYHIGTASG